MYPLQLEAASTEPETDKPVYLEGFFQLHIEPGDQTNILCDLQL